MNDLRQAKLVKILIENPEKPMTEAMKEAGYSESYANASTLLKKGKSFREALDDILDNDSIAATLKAIMNRRDPVMREYDIDTPDDVIFNKISIMGGEFPEIKIANRTTQIKKGRGKKATFEEVQYQVKEAHYFVPDYVAIDRISDKIAKLRGDYAPEKKEFKGNIAVSTLLDELQNEDGTTHKPTTDNGNPGN